MGRILHDKKSVPHDAVMAWLESCGTEDELAAPLFFQLEDFVSKYYYLTQR